MPSLAGSKGLTLTSRSDGPRGRSGCQTCRARKVKCDRKFPECSRCTSSGRPCEGYGVWGGGTPNDAAKGVLWRAGIFVRAAAPKPQKISLLNLSSADMESFEWFERRTIPKLPGCFRSRYWSVLLSQASVTEPAVLHAILAVGSVHRAGVVTETRPNLLTATSAFDLTNDGLSHYIKAIGQLRTHTTITDITVLRVILVSCIAFSSLELMRGHIISAKGHIKNGMRLMRENRWLTDANEPAKIVTQTPDSVEEWIAEAFKRFYVQMVIYDVLFLNIVDTDLAWPERYVIPHVFGLYSVAWTKLEQLVLQSLWMLKTSNQCRIQGLLPKDNPWLVERQAQLHADLNSWESAYRAGEAVMFNDGVNIQKDFTELLLNHRLATLLNEVSLQTDEEMASDATSFLFAGAVRLVVNLWQQAVPFAGIAFPSEPIDFCHSILDIGALHIVYYAAVHCRARPIKLRALKALKLLQHREGFWDGKLTAAIGQKIVETELGDTFENMERTMQVNGGSLFEPEARNGASSPAYKRRVREPRLVVSGEPAESVTVYHTVISEGRDVVAKLAEYDVQKMKWSNQA